MEIIASVLIIASVVLPVVAVLGVVFFVGFFAYTLIAERREAALEPEPEPATTAATTSTAVNHQSMPVAA